MVSERGGSHVEGLSGMDGSSLWWMVRELGVCVFCPWLPGRKGWGGVLKRTDLGVGLGLECCGNVRARPHNSGKRRVILATVKMLGVV